MILAWGSFARADMALRDVRFARGDVDGDGRMEIVAGGRLGPVAPIDAPRSARRAGLGVYRRAGNVLRPLFEREDLRVVADVAAGDLDGDGRDEVIAVGMGQLSVWGWRNGTLVRHAVEMLDGMRTDRVAVGDLNGDGRDEVAATVYEIGFDAEIGQTDVVFYRWRGGGLIRERHHTIDLHVGDLCVAERPGTGRAMVILETGAGEEGGELRGLDANGMEAFRWTPAQYSVRALSLDALDGRLAVGRLDGVIGVYEIGTRDITLRYTSGERAGFSNVVMMPDRTVFVGRSILDIHALPMGF